MADGVVVVTVDAQIGELELPPTVELAPPMEANVPRFTWVKGTGMPADGIVTFAGVEDGGIPVAATDVGLVCCL